MTSIGNRGGLDQVQVVSTSIQPAAADKSLSRSSGGKLPIIDRIRLGVIELALPRPFHFLRGAVDRRKYSIAEVWLDSGHVGTSYSLVRSIPAAVVAEDSAKDLIGRQLADPDTLIKASPPWQTRTELSRWPIAPGLALIEIAIWDAHARALGVSVGTLLGPIVATRIPAMAVVGYRFDGVETALDEVAAAVNAGFASVKLPIGDRPPTDDEFIVREIRRTYPALRIHVDAHWNFDTVVEALAHIEPLLAHGLVWIEDPLPVGVSPRWIGGDLPQAVGDDVLDPQTLITALANGKTVRPDVSSLGLSGWRRVVAEAAALSGLVTNHVHGKLHAPILSTVASLHPSGVERFYDEASLDPIEPLLRGGARVVSGEWILPDEPGFGISFDRSVWTKLVTWKRELRRGR